MGSKNILDVVPMTSDIIVPVFREATLSWKFTQLQANQTINKKVVTDFQSHQE